MRAGDIIFVRGRNLFSTAVRYFDPGEFSHVAIAVSETHILEAQWFTKSRITPFYFNDYEIFDLNLTPEEREFVVHNGIALTGKWYDYRQILSIVLRNPKNNPNFLICSEMVASLLGALGKFPYEEIIDLNPNQLYQKLKGGMPLTIMYKKSGKR